MENKKIIDVRSRMEFMGGHVEGSINIPLQEIPEHVVEIEAMGDVILCCASGNRSGQAMSYLKAQGVNCENGGGWMELNFKIQNA
jgi:rhodanese-related sulfurtransferase